MLFLVGVCFIAFFVRLLPRLIVPCFVSDTYFHLAMIKRIKKQGWFKTQKQMPSYPLGYHWLLSFLPTYFLPLWERINGAVFDTLHIILFALVFSLFADGSVSEEIIWGWAPLLLALSPAWLYVGIGPRAYHATPRVFGELLIGGIFSSLWIFQTTGIWWWWIVAIGLGAYLLNISKFGAQVLLSFCMILALLQGNLSILFVLLAAGLIAYIASKGTYSSVLRGQIRHLAWYARAVKERRLPVASRNSFDLTRRIYKDKGVSEALEYLVFGNSYVAGFYQHQLLVFILLISFFGKGYTNSPAFIWHWLIAGVFMWLLSSTRRFLFIGEAERYLFAVAIPEYFLIGTWLAISSFEWRWYMLGHSFFLWMVYLRRFRNVYRRSHLESSARKSMIHFLQRLPPMRVLPFDMSPMWDLAYKTTHKHFLIDSKFGMEVKHDDVFMSYPYTRWEAVSLLDIELVVVSKKALEKAQELNIPNKFQLSDLDKIFDNKAYQIYRISSNIKLADVKKA